MTGSFEVNSVEETWGLARKFAEVLKPGDVVCLEGDLGAGKTTLFKAIKTCLYGCVAYGYEAINANALMSSLWALLIN
mgnify:CR=1 FL=1